MGINYFEILKNLVTFDDTNGGCHIMNYSFYNNDDFIVLGFDGDKRIVKANLKTHEIDADDKLGFYSDITRFRNSLSVYELRDISCEYLRDGIPEELLDSDKEMEYWKTLYSVENTMGNSLCTIRPYGNSMEELELMISIQNSYSIDDISCWENLYQFIYRSYDLFEYKDYIIFTPKNFNLYYEVESSAYSRDCIMKCYPLKEILNLGRTMFYAVERDLITEEQLEELIQLLYVRMKEDMWDEICERKELRSWD